MCHSLQLWQRVPIIVTTYNAAISVEINMTVGIPFKPGISGNPSGRPRRKIPRPDDELHALGLSPVKEILKLIPNLREKDQLTAWLELLSYCAAKPKETPVDEVGNAFAAISEEQLLKLVQAKQKILEAG